MNNFLIRKFFLVSVPVLLCPVGLLIIGVLIDNIGKVITLQINLVPMTLSWLLLLFADSYRAIMIARILLGFCFGKLCFMQILKYSSLKQKGLFSPGRCIKERQIKGTEPPCPSYFYLWA